MHNRFFSGVFLFPSMTYRRCSDKSNNETGLVRGYEILYIKTVSYKMVSQLHDTC
jgi:hypothetical protein